MQYTVHQRVCLLKIFQVVFHPSPPYLWSECIGVVKMDPKCPMAFGSHGRAPSITCLWQCVPPPCILVTFTLLSLGRYRLYWPRDVAMEKNGSPTFWSPTAKMAKCGTTSWTPAMYQGWVRVCQQLDPWTKNRIGHAVCSNFISRSTWIMSIEKLRGILPSNRNVEN